MKKMLAAMMAVVMVLGLVACGGDKKESTKAGENQTEGSIAEEIGTDGEKKEDGERLKVGFSLPSMTFPFYVRMHEQIMEEAEERNWDVSFVDGNLDAGTQFNGLQDMINDDVDILIVATWYIDALTDIFVQCEEKGIGVFLMDNMVIPAECENAITFTTGTDNYNAGAVGGTWYAEYLKENGKDSINMITIAQQSEQTLKRCAGFTETLTENGIKVNILNKYNGGNRETAMQVMEDALTAYSDLDLAYGASAQDSLGAYDATAGANRGEVQVFGFDGEDEELGLIDAGGNYIATITQDPKGQANILADKVDLWVNGENFAQIEETPAGIYCADGQLSGADILK